MKVIFMDERDMFDYRLDSDGAIIGALFDKLNRIIDNVPDVYFVPTNISENNIFTTLKSTMINEDNIFTMLKSTMNNEDNACGVDKVLTRVLDHIVSPNQTLNIKILDWLKNSNNRIENYIVVHHDLDTVCNENHSNMPILNTIPLHMGHGITDEQVQKIIYILNKDDKETK